MSLYQQKKKVRKKQLKAITYKKVRVNSLMITWCPINKSFIVKHKKNVIFQSEFNKQECVNWAKRRAMYSTTWKDKGTALVREFLKITKGKRLLDMGEGNYLKETDRQEVVLYKNNEAFCTLIRFKHRVVLEFVGMKDSDIIKEVFLCGFTAYIEPPKFGHFDYLYGE